MERPVCGFYATAAGCKKGEKCDFLHQEKSEKPQKQQPKKQRNKRLVNNGATKAEPRTGPVKIKYETKKREGCDVVEVVNSKNFKKLPDGVVYIGRKNPKFGVESPLGKKKSLFLSCQFLFSCSS